MQIEVLPRDDRTNGWTAILPPAPPPRRLEGAQSADYAVIGAGFAGLAAARRLAELAPDRRIVLIEAQRVGDGSSGRNSGFIIDLPHEAESLKPAAIDLQRRILRLNRFAIGRLRSLVQAQAIDCEWTECGMYRGAVSPRAGRFLDPYAQMIGRLGLPFERLDRRALTARLGTSLYHEAIHSAGTVLVQPAALVRGLARSLPGNVELFVQSPVTSFEPAGGIRMTAGEGSLTAAKVILAVNGLVPAFGHYRRHLFNLGLWASLSRPLGEAQRARLGSEPSWGMTPADARGGITMRLTPAGRLLVRAITYSEPWYRPHTEDLARIRREHCRILERRFPALAPIAIEHTWTGFVSKSWNAAPVFGELAPGVFSACVQNGVGCARGTYQGELAADLVMGNDHELLRDMLAHARPTPLPPQPLTRWGASAHIQWLEWLSRGER
ncbi:MAG: FAD-binding oxidoreductase [Pseudomonadota bacterium]|nr:FAD-binding oxidoreductase [Pseudomonadota bacterium]